MSPIANARIGMLAREGPRVKYGLKSANATMRKNRDAFRWFGDKTTDHTRREEDDDVDESHKESRHVGMATNNSTAWHNKAHFA